MDLQNFIIDNYLKPRIKKNGCLVIYDTWNIKKVLQRIDNKKIKIIDTTKSDLDCRKSSVELSFELAKTKSDIDGFIIYIPFSRPNGNARLYNPFTTFELLGSYFPQNDADEYINICKLFKPDEISQIDEIFKSNVNPPDFEVINNLGENQKWPTLSYLLKVESKLEITKSFLTPNHNQILQLNKSAEWKNECKKFFKKSFDLDIKNFNDFNDLSDQIWQFFLFSEFVFDLPDGNPNFPNALNQISKADKTKLSFVEKVCDDLRNDLTNQELYIEKALDIENKLKLKEHFNDFSDLGVKDTFAFEDKTYLDKSLKLLKENKFVDVQNLLSTRKNSIWLRFGENTPLQWLLINICLKILQKCRDLEESFGSNLKDLTSIINFYTQEYYVLDHLIREFISIKDDVFSDKFNEIITITQQNYYNSVGKLQSQFVLKIKESGWPPANFQSNYKIFDSYISPKILDKESKIVYFMIDALRYELGMDLKNRLENSNLKLSIMPSFSALPSVTNIGMASLLPEANNEISYQTNDNQFNVLYSNENINDASKRMNVFKKRYGDQFQEINLDEISSNLKNKIKKNVKVLVVRSYSMDQLLETNQHAAIKTIQNTFDKIKFSLNALSELNFTDAFISSDHGFLFNLYYEDRGKVIIKPQGDWQDIHDRCLIGTGTEDDNSISFLANEIGLKGEQKKFVFPKSIFPYKKNKFYLHGGISLQETLVPLINIELVKQKLKQDTSFEIKISYKDSQTDKITTRNPIINIEVFSSDLVYQAEGEEIEIVIKILNSNDEIIGEMKSNIDNPDFKSLKILYGEKRKIPIRLFDEYEGDVIIRAVNPNNEIILSEIILKTDYLL